MKRASSLLLTTFLLAFQLSAQTTIQTNVPSLKKVYANDFSIGCILSYGHIGFPTDPWVAGQSTVVAPQGGTLVKYHMNSMSPGNWMKSTYIVDLAGSASAYNGATTQAAKDSIDVHPKVTFNGNIIAQLNWAKRQGFTFRGHTLVWHSQTPGTAFFRSGYSETGTRLTKEQMLLRMENYIKEVIRIIHLNWPGLLSAMDVVNEAVSDANGAFRTQGNEWYTTIGDQSYVMKAFECARKYTVLYGETQMKLYYNDYGTSSSAKADGIVRLCKPIYEAGFLDGIGMQEHDNSSYPSAQSWVSSYNKFYPICSEMAVTEIDVSTQSGTNTPSAAVLETQANQYAMLFKCFVERSYRSGRGKIINVTKDGLNDQYTFVTNQSSSLWDVNNQCKPAFYAVAEVGKNYNKLDSLINVAKNLNQADYSALAWEKITGALTSAKSAASKNYSATDPAVKGLANAITLLSGAMTSGTSGIDEFANSITIKPQGGLIYLGNLERGAKITVYGINGAVIQQLIANADNMTISYTVPCIVRVASGKNFCVRKIIQ